MIEILNMQFAYYIPQPFGMPIISHKFVVQQQSFCHISEQFCYML